jgi:hypothetical protein
MLFNEGENFLIGIAVYFESNLRNIIALVHYPY